MKTLYCVIFLCITSCQSPHPTEISNNNQSLTQINKAELPRHLGLTSVSMVQRLGNFQVFESHPGDLLHNSVFVPASYPIIRYYNNGAYGHKDTLEIAGTYIPLNGKEALDPSSIKIFEFKIDQKDWLLFLGKAPSASGTGVRITRYVMSPKNITSLSSIYKFYTFFGDENFIGYCGSDEKLSFLKIFNSEIEIDNYIGYIVQTEISDKGSTPPDIEFKYLMNDTILLSSGQGRACF